jgi:phage gpG-like protein
MNATELKKVLDEVVPKIRAGVVKVAAVEWRKTVHKNFTSKGRPAWPVRKKISKKQRGTNILVISGALKNVSTVPDIAAGKVTLHADPRAKAYAKIHNEGGRIDMPPRELKFRKSKGRTVFASSQHKKVTKKTTSKAYTINIPKREFTNIPAEDFPRWVETMKRVIKL